MTKKYILVDNLPRVNELVDEGYKVHTMTVHTYHDDVAGGVMSINQYLMSLFSEKAYDNISNLKDVSPDDAYEYLSNGWIVADAYSKFVRMVKKNV